MKLPKLIWSDYIVAVALLLFWGAHFVTNVVVAQYVSVAENVQQAAAIVEVMEAAPVARIALRSAQLGLIFSSILTPALVFGVYYLARRRSFEVAGQVAFVLLFVAITDVLNDLSRLAGLMI